MMLRRVLQRAALPRAMGVRALSLESKLSPYSAGEGNWIVKDMSGATAEEVAELSEALKEEIKAAPEERTFFTALPYKNIEFQFGGNRFISGALDEVKTEFLQALTTNGEPYLFTGEEPRFPNKVYLTGNTVEIAECWWDVKENEYTHADLDTNPELLGRIQAAVKRGYD